VTSLGIEAKLHAVNTGPSTPYFTTGCAEDANISAVWIQ
jgi:hypothetical protein